MPMKNILCDDRLHTSMTEQELVQGYYVQNFAGKERVALRINELALHVET